VPINLSFSQTGSIPTSSIRIFLAASVNEAFGPMHSGFFVLISLTFMFVLSFVGPSPVVIFDRSPMAAEQLLCRGQLTRMRRFPCRA
jgi:hypothetical protein